VHFGMEDNHSIAPGTYTGTNAELVEKIVRISRDLGREVASAEEARGICGLEGKTRHVL
jgi:3-keto-5-aminohexanoate cleavage enzyme